MFTGLIEKTASVKDIISTSSGDIISYHCPDGFSDVKIGDSIAVNGVCLTVKEIKNNIISVDVMKETRFLTNLKTLKKGDIINLERALKFNSRLDGHIISGHIDTTAVVKEIIQDGFSKKITFSCNTDLIVKKASIAINGISLTVANVDKDTFEVSLIPLTQNKTNLKDLKINDIVNIEYDMFSKYVKKFIENTKDNKKSKITMEFLKNNGF